jgi:nitroreductase
MDVIEAIGARRAYRSLEPVEIPDEIVRDLSRGAGLAASCFNNQPWRFVFVRDPDVLGELFGALSRGNRWATAASMIVAVVSRADYDCQIRDREYFLFDTGMATAHLILRATELGLVAHPIAGYSPKKARAALGIPEEMSVVTLVIVGKRAGAVSDLLSEDQARSEAERPARLPPEEFAFMDRYEAEVSPDD